MPDSEFLLSGVLITNAELTNAQLAANANNLRKMLFYLFLILKLFWA
jgi:hypothetical protein